MSDSKSSMPFQGRQQGEINDRQPGMAPPTTPDSVPVVVDGSPSVSVLNLQEGMGRAGSSAILRRTERVFARFTAVRRSLGSCQRAADFLGAHSGHHTSCKESFQSSQGPRLILVYHTMGEAKKKNFPWSLGRIAAQPKHNAYRVLYWMELELDIMSLSIDTASTGHVLFYL